MESISSNARLYEEYRPMVEALAKEGKYLRKELLSFALALGSMNCSPDTCEALVELFTRDIHAAHQEFQKRLSNFSNRVLADEKEKNEKASGEIQSLRKSLVEKDKEIEILRGRLDQLEQKARQDSDFRKSLKLLLSAVQSQKSGNLNGTMDILRIFRERDSFAFTIMLSSLISIQSEQENIKRFRQEVNSHLDNIQKLSTAWDSFMGANRHKEILKEKIAASQCVQAINGSLANESHHIGQISKAREEMGNRSSEMRNLVADGSDLSKLLNFLDRELS